MSYSPIEDRYLSTLTQQQFPDMPPEPSLDGMQLAAGPSDTVTDAGTSSGFTFTAQHSDLTTSASAAAIVAADSVDGAISLTVTADGDDNKVIGGIGYIGSKRYVRMNGVGTTGTDATVKVYGILNKPHRAKTTFVGANVAAT